MEIQKRTTTEWEEVRQKIVDIQRYFALFKSEFLDRGKFKEFADDLSHQVGDHTNIFITGYFSEIIRDELVKAINGGSCNVKLITPALDINKSRDRKNLQVLKRLNEAKAEVRVNDRLHARFLVSYLPGLLSGGMPIWRGTLVIGSFDFNKEGMGKERHDAGIRTSHPDLIESAVKLFNQMWNESLPLLEKYGEEIKKFKL